MIRIRNIFYTGQILGTAMNKTEQLNHTKIMINQQICTYIVAVGGTRNVQSHAARHFLVLRLIVQVNRKSSSSVRMLRFFSHNITDHWEKRKKYFATFFYRSSSKSSSLILHSKVSFRSRSRIWYPEIGSNYSPGPRLALWSYFTAICHN